ncbi:hypothetical protein, partial [Streptomyces sp. NPDC003327]
MEQGAAHERATERPSPPFADPARTEDETVVRVRGTAPGPASSPASTGTAATPAPAPAPAATPAP